MRKISGIRLAAATGAVLLAVLASGCATASPGISRASVQACTAFGVHAIEHQVKVTRVPQACAGLSRAARDQAVGRAVYIVAGAGHAKAAWRQRASSVSGYLGDLVVAVAPPAAAAPAPASTVIPATRGSGTGGVLAALLAWLLTVGSGATIVARWLRRGRRRVAGPRAGGPRRRARRVLSPLVSGHLGLAVAGLVVWSAYLVIGWRPLAWLSAGLLLPVAGLGMAVLVAGLDRPSTPAASAAPAAPAPAMAVPAGVGPAGTGPAGAGPAGTVPAGAASAGTVPAGAAPAMALPAAAARAAAEAGVPAAPAGPAPQPSRQISATFVAAAHGLFAMATLALVMLALTGAR